MRRSCYAALVPPHCVNHLSYRIADSVYNSVYLLNSISSNLSHSFGVTQNRIHPLKAVYQFSDKHYDVNKQDNDQQSNYRKQYAF